MRRYLEEVKAALVADGFHDTFAQWPRRSQAFGLVKDFPGHRQMHVRAFWDGRLEAEIEFSRLCVNHWVSPRDPAHQELVVLLDKLGVAPHGVNHHYRPMTGQKKTWPDACLDHRVKRAFSRSLTMTRLLVLAVREQGIRDGVRALRQGSVATVDAMEAVTAVAVSAAETVAPTSSDARISTPRVGSPPTRRRIRGTVCGF
jgi:hypothetical protein